MAEIVDGRYQLLKKLGSGATGEVYKARDLRLKRSVAIKRVLAEKRGQRAVLERLHKEAEYLARVDHPNVVMVHDIIDSTESFCIVMELVKGQPFVETFRKRPMPEAELIGYFRQMLAALEAVHEVGLIHRDVNPRNVMVTREGVVKLTDFGLSGFVNDVEHRMGGTLAYMAPETMRRRGRLGFGVDIYSLGFLSYQAVLSLAGFKKLYGAKRPKDWIRWVLSSEPFATLHSLDAPVSEGFAAIIARMLEKDPARRYQKTSQVQSDLEALLARPVDDGACGGSRGTSRPGGAWRGAIERARALIGGTRSTPVDSPAVPPATAGAASTNGDAAAGAERED